MMNHSIFHNTFIISMRGLSNGRPNIVNLYHKAAFKSAAIRLATNSEPNVMHSIVFCHFAYQ